MINVKFSQPKARKDYHCMASIWILESGVTDGVGLEFTFEEKRQLVIARQKNWKILKGEKYLRCTNIQEGQLIEFIAIPEMNRICQKYGLYEE